MPSFSILKSSLDRSVPEIIWIVVACVLSLWPKTTTVTYRALCWRPSRLKMICCRLMRRPKLMIASVSHKHVLKISSNKICMDYRLRRMWAQSTMPMTRSSASIHYNSWLKWHRLSIPVFFKTENNNKGHAAQQKSQVKRKSCVYHQWFR